MKENKLDLSFSQKEIVSWALVILLIFIGPVLFLGSEVYVTVHDNLDSEVANLMMLKLSDNLLGLSGSDIVPNVFNGLQRAYFHSEFNIIRVLFYFFSAFTAYEINTVFVRLVGFIGMLLLARDFFNIQDRKIGVLLLALTFSFLPIYSIYGLSVMGQPLLVWSFLNLAKSKKNAISVSYILLFPFYSHIAFTAPFVLSIAGVYGLYLMVKTPKRFNWWYAVALFGMLATYIIANFSIIQTILVGAEVSHRTQMVKMQVSFWGSLKQSLFILRRGQYHSSEFYAESILLVSMISLFFAKNKKTIGLVLLSVVTISLLEGFSSSISLFLLQYSSIFGVFQINRFTFFLPLLTFSLMLLLLQEKRINKSVLYGLTLLQFGLIIGRNHEILWTYLKPVTPQLIKFDLPNGVSKFVSKIDNAPTFKSYYAVNQFDEISAFINKTKSTYRVISVGLPPSVSQFNGFYTLDSYQNNYPLRYKLAFREIILGELNKNEEIKLHFDNWANRCYLESVELYSSCGYNCTENYNAHIAHLSLNSQAFNELGGEYLISSIPINVIGKKQIIEEKVFENSESSWKIYLYKI